MFIKVYMLRDNKKEVLSETNKIIESKKFYNAIAGGFINVENECEKYYNDHYKEEMIETKNLFNRDYIIEINKNSYNPINKTSDEVKDTKCYHQIISRELTDKYFIDEETFNQLTNSNTENTQK